MKGLRFFLYGFWRLNAGPANVNKSLVFNSDSYMDYIKSRNKICVRFEVLYKCLKYKYIVISGLLPQKWCLFFLKIFKKKVFYIMHGDIVYENEINKLNASEKYENFYSLLEQVTCILPVSEKYARWVSDRYIQYKEKIRFLNNGVTIIQRPKKVKIPYTIAVSGGNRFIKNNGIVCKAVELLINKGYDCQVLVYGRFYNDNEDFSTYPFVKKMGHLEKEEYFNSLDKVEVFVVNSLVESFGLVVADALSCNCSLLMSDNVGALSIINDANANDIIYDCFDIYEVADKLEKLFAESNSDRLYSSIDLNKSSEKQAYLNLKNILNEFVSTNK